ncbi:MULTISPECIES: hypothetical protein [unclassified Yoonia]|uniref:hypothetical protein n=1 Tax=unclassified Yoonia TaxID=2629118 RepID=UPI002AFE2AB8|nr:MULTISPECIES: hypothetical protein [unclassified Yoonia]
MPDKSSPTPPPQDRQIDPVDDAVPMDEIIQEVAPQTSPDVETALDDDEGGADAIDPDTGVPYHDEDAGADAPHTTRQGGTKDA